MLLMTWSYAVHVTVDVRASQPSLTRQRQRVTNRVLRRCRATKTTRTSEVVEPWLAGRAAHPKQSRAMQKSDAIDSRPDIKWREDIDQRVQGRRPTWMTTRDGRAGRLTTVGGTEGDVFLYLTLVPTRVLTCLLT